MKKYYSISFAILLAVLFPSQALAYTKVTPYQDFTSWYLEKTESEAVPFVSAAMIETGSYTPLYFHAESRVMPTASLAKLVTAGALQVYPVDWASPLSFTAADNRGDFLDYIGLNDSLALLRLQEGDSVTKEQAFASMLIGSANNAAQALPKSVALNIDEFAAVMNAVAKDWGLKHSSFVEPTGLSLDNLSTAHDMALATCKALENPMTRKYAGYSYYKMETALGEEKTIQHTVHALREDLDYSIFLGAKTGYLHETGFHVTAEMKTPQGKTICASVLSTATRQEGEDALLLMREWVDEMYL